MKIISASIALYLLLGIVSAGVHRFTRHKATSQLRLQVDAWWWIFPVVSVAIALYPFGPLLLTLLIGALAARELSAMTGNPTRQFILQLALFSSIAAAWLTGPGWWILGLACILLLILGIGRKGDRLIWLILLLTAVSISLLSGIASQAWLFYLIVLTALNDIGQYVFGTLFGRARIAPAISPNKTWQGLAGGIATSVGVSLCLGTWLELDDDGVHLVAHAIALAVAGFFGDLLFSAVKRTLGVKDFSNLIPGHGGILDRVDSLVFTGPLLYAFLQRFE